MGSAIAGRGRLTGGHRALVAVLSLLALATISCAESAASTLRAAGTPDGVVVVTDSPGDGTPPTTVTRVESRDDLVDEQRIVPALVQVDPNDPTRVVVRFPGGGAACHGARLAIDEQPATVRVFVFVGTPPSGTGGCAEAPGTLEVVATLTHGLGTRELIWQH